jgi:hypothetical protein
MELSVPQCGLIESQTCVQTQEYDEGNNLWDWAQAGSINVRKKSLFANINPPNVSHDCSCLSVSLSALSCLSVPVCLSVCLSVPSPTLYGIQT